MIQSTRNGFEMAEEEVSRIYAEPVQGKQSIAVQHDMKQWAEREGLWPSNNYQRIIRRHAEARGWTQEGFTGMEIVDETV